MDLWQATDEQVIKAAERHYPKGKVIKLFSRTTGLWRAVKLRFPGGDIRIYNIYDWMV